MTVAIETMNAIVTTGRASWRIVRPKVSRNVRAGMPAIIIGMNANIAAMTTSVPAADRKSSRNVAAYGDGFAAIGGSRSTIGTAFPASSRYAPGQENSHTGNRN